MSTSLDGPLPVVVVANDPWDPRFRLLRDKCALIRFNRVHVRSIIKFLRDICVEEGLEFDLAALRSIAERSGGDVRSAIIDLQVASAGKGRILLEDVEWLGYRDRVSDVFNVLRGIFSSKTCLSARDAFANSAVDYNYLLEWLHENLPLQYGDFGVLFDAYDALSRADVYFGRIRRLQDWSLLGYAIDLMTAGVAMAGVGSYRFVKYSFPERIRFLSRTKSVRALKARLCGAVAEKCHVSSVLAASEYLPFLKVIFESSPEMASKIALWLDLDDDVVGFCRDEPHRQTYS